MAAEDPGGRRGLLLTVVIVVAVLLVAGFALKGLLGGAGSKPKAPPKISLVPNVPPPPPPPKEEKRPTPPKEQKEIKAEPQAEKAAPADPALKMEGAAGDGPSAFAAGRVSSEDLSKLGSGNGALTNPFNSYANAIKAELQRHLAKRSELRRRKYGIELRVWIADDGRLLRHELLGTTNDAETDETIGQMLAALPAFAAPPPPRMPQPVRLRIVTAGRN